MIITRPAVVNLNQVPRSSAICSIRAMLYEGPSCPLFTVGSESLQMNADGRTAEREPSGDVSRSDFLLRLLGFSFDPCGTCHGRKSMHFKSTETLRNREVGRSRSLDSQAFCDTVDTAGPTSLSPWCWSDPPNHFSGFRCPWFCSPVWICSHISFFSAFVQAVPLMLVIFLPYSASQNFFLFLLGLRASSIVEVWYLIWLLNNVCVCKHTDT